MCLSLLPIWLWFNAIYYTSKSFLYVLFAREFEVQSYEFQTDAYDSASTAACVSHWLNSMPMPINFHRIWSLELKEMMMKMTTMMAIKATAVASGNGGGDVSARAETTTTTTQNTRDTHGGYLCSIFAFGWMAGWCYSMVWYWRKWSLYEKLLFHRHRHRHRRTHIVVHVYQIHATIET